jgi:plasmid stabilization system protein ParE
MTSSIFLPEAADELETAVHCYEARSPGLGTQFSVEVEIAVKAIAENPETWPIFTKKTRRRLLKRFPLAIFYRIEPTTIVIVAVAHLWRKPNYWKDR